VEHRLFCHITLNWRGRPLTSHEVIVQTIAATTTRTGLRVHAALDTGSYPTGASVSDTEMTALPITRHAFHGDWNYTLHPPPDSPPTRSQPPPRAPTEYDTATLAHPVLTGMSQQDLQHLTTALAALRHNLIQDRQHQRRVAAGKKPHAPRPGRPVQFAFADRLLATILHLRLQLPETTLTTMFATSRSSIRRAISETRQLLDQHGVTINAITPSAPILDLLNAAATDTATSRKIKMVS
jgi:Rhodopirellula transposase DDE domain